MSLRSLFDLRLFLNNTVIYDQHPVRDPLSLGVIVGRHDDLGPVLFSHVIDNGFDNPGVFFINGRGRFIKEEYLRIKNEGARNAKTLGFAA